jgi:RND family efflux transporter MFP subunit
MKSAVRILTLGCGALVATSLTGCEGGHAEPPTPAPAVTVSHPQALAFQEYLELTGSTVASRTVNLNARVEGYLRKVYFHDGSYVRAGTPLFLIEPEPYAAKVQLNEAQQISAAAEYQRQQRLIAQQATSKSSLESWLAQRDAARANTELARINLSYTRISAPFTGRIGRHLIDEGNLVGNGQATLLATIEQLSPIYVYFNVNERDVLRVRQAIAAQGLTRMPDSVPVEAALQTDEGYSLHGTLNFVDTSINPGSGTLQVRASFTNEDRRLQPGMFVRVRVAIGPQTDYSAVPDTAVGHDQAGSYLLVLDRQSRVTQLRVKTGGILNGMRAITQGVASEDRVIVDGLLNAIPGEPATALERPILNSASTAPDNQATPRASPRTRS